MVFHSIPRIKPVNNYFGILWYNVAIRLPPLQGLFAFISLTQGGARFRGLCPGLFSFARSGLRGFSLSLVTSSPTVVQLMALRRTFEHLLPVSSPAALTPAL